MQKFLSGFDLKIIGIIFMVIDHVNSYLGNFLGWPLWVSLLGRFVAPLFVFMLVEGFQHTSNRQRYFLRLFIGGIGMYGINIAHNLITQTSFVNPYTGEFDVFLLLQGQNIFMTLALLFALIWLLETILKKGLSWQKRILLSFVLILILPFLLFSEGGPYELVMALIFYFFRGQFGKIAIGVSLFSGLLLAHGIFNFLSLPDMGSLYQVLTFDNEFMMITVLPFIYFYNGQRGGSGAVWQRNLFYYFYPLHLIIIYVLRDILMAINA
ncbi:TraX family protein [Enterococcus sp. LJL120]